MACCYAIAHEKASDLLTQREANGEDRSALEKNQNKQMEENANAAMKYLNLAGEAGLFDSVEMRMHATEDNDLNSLKNRQDFKLFQQQYLRDK